MRPIHGDKGQFALTLIMRHSEGPRFHQRGEESRVSRFKLPHDHTTLNPLPDGLTTPIAAASPVRQ
jgi:hypothetical protein